jgi:hypothetical protein
MRATILLVALAAGPAPAQAELPVSRYRVTVVERPASGGTLTATLTATRRRYTTAWILECLDAGDRSARPEPSTYRGSSVGEDRWLEHKGPSGRFTIALGQPQLWMANLPGCPRVGQPRIERLP